MFSKVLFYRKPTAAPRPTLLQRHLRHGLDAMRDTAGLTVDDDAGYDVLAVAVVRLLGTVPPDATAEDMLAALSQRSLTHEPLEAQ